MVSKLVLVASNPCETAAGALYSALNAKARVEVLQISSIKSLDENQVAAMQGEHNETLMIGTYWINKLPLFVQCFPNVSFVVLCPGSPTTLTSECKYENVKFVYDSNPCAFVLQLAEDEGESETCVRLIRKVFKNAIQMIDDRFNFRNVDINQPFFTGIFNVENTADNISLLDKFYNFFQGRYDEEELTKQGRAILNAQMMMAKERVINNSKQVQLKDGTKAVMTEASELVNLTHDALHNKYPESVVTLVVGIKFGTKMSQEDELSYSIRSFNPSVVNAQSLAQAIGGDGTKTTAGGRVGIHITCPF